jgi:hypothetical protein
MFDLKYYSELKKTIDVYHDIMKDCQKMNETLKLSVASRRQFRDKLDEKYIAFNNQFARLLTIHKEYVIWYRAY